MNRELTVGSVAPIALPPAPDPNPHRDPIALAIVAEMTEMGYERSTVAGVIRRAAIPAEEFERRYEDLDDCALDAYERLIADFTRQVGTAFNEQGEWPAALRAAAYSCADWMTERPAMTAFGSAEVLKMRSELARVRREEVFGFCAELIDRGREAAPDPSSVPESAPIFAIGGIAQLLTHRVQEDAEVDIRVAIPEMMHRIVCIYLGDEIAEAEWDAPRP